MTILLPTSGKAYRRAAPIQHSFRRWHLLPIMGEGPSSENQSSPREAATAGQSIHRFESKDHHVKKVLCKGMDVLGRGMRRNTFVDVKSIN
jgi:hypothetical protein